MAKTRDYHHGNLQQELLRAALALLDEAGSEAIGIRQVAKAVGVAHSAPANHFKNKQALLNALRESLVTQFIETVTSQLLEPDQQDPIQHLANVVLDYGLQYPHRYRLLWQSQYPLHQAMDEIYQTLTNLLQPYAKQKQVDVESQAIAVWSLIHGYVTLRLQGHLSPGQDQVTGMPRQGAIINVLLDGIK